MSAAGKALDQATRHLHREAGFADPARPRDRDQAHILTQQKFFGGSHFFFPPHKPGPLHGKIRREGFHYSAQLASPRSGRVWPQVPARDIGQSRSLPDGPSALQARRVPEPLGAFCVSPLSRFNCEQISAACWKRFSRSFSSALCDDCIQSGG